MNHIHGVLSMLHEPVRLHSAERRFRNDPVISWTIDRLGQSQTLAGITILCWEDQRVAAEKAMGDAPVDVKAIGERHAVPLIDAVSAARRWADGWRGGPMNTCDFDLGFHPRLARDLALNIGADALLLVDPAAGLIDAVLVDQLIEHGRANPEPRLHFTSAAPGLCGVLIKADLLEQLAKNNLHPGRLLHYMPDQPVLDPVSGKGHFFVPAPVARTLQRFKIDSDRQSQRLRYATEDLNGHLVSTEAEELVRRMESIPVVDVLPREVTIELNTRRATRPIYSASAQLQIDRPEMSRSIFQQLIGELAQADDMRITLAGAGDPLLHPHLFEMIDDARSAGIRGIHLDTDLLDVGETTCNRLVESGVDMVSVHVPAITPATYQAVMGRDGYGEVLQNIRRLMETRQLLDHGTPLLMPTFIKCRANFAEMESWYDQWLRAIGCAVILGPSTFAGQIADIAQADMTPPKRRPCQRIRSRLMVLSDGRVVTCEEDVLGAQTLGTVGQSTMSDLWQDAMGKVRADHATGNFAGRPLCGNCCEWHRA